jgi:hypothetical protein
MRGRKDPNKGPRWRPGSFLDNFSAAADAVGFSNAELAWGLARVQWESTEDREAFLSALTGRSSRQVIAEGASGKLS